MIKRIVQLVSVIVLCISIYVILDNVIQEPEYIADEIVAEEISEAPVIDVDDEQQEDENVNDVIDPLSYNIDFDSYLSINADVYAYIYIPNTAIDYPVLQHKSDNNYYLNHCIDGSEGYPGCIYSEKENSKDFSDANTVLYGHNMKNGTMFRDLHLYEDKEFFENNRFIYIYTPEKLLVYEIFAAYTATDDHLLYLCDFNNKDEFLSYLNSIKNRTVTNMYSKTALIDDNIEFTSDDKILSLQTCTQDESKRTVVQAVLRNVYDAN